jgi:hypothetical protein
MPHAFDPGPAAEPFLTLAREYPGEETYPADSFRVEWGPIFHRGRLDGSARVLVIGQDPATSETIARRILVGAAGHRVQGLLAKLGIDRSYAMVNTFLYSVRGQQGGESHDQDAAIAAYRGRWLQALLAPGRIEAAIALGHLADSAWRAFASSGATAGAASLPYAHVTHPTQPDSSSAHFPRAEQPAKRAEAIKAMLANWNAALTRLHPHIAHPDAARPLALYGDAFADVELAEIPEQDMPAGLPAWMRSPSAWAQRTTGQAAEGAAIVVTRPPGG